MQTKSLSERVAEIERGLEFCENPNNAEAAINDAIRIIDELQADLKNENDFKNCFRYHNERLILENQALLAKNRELEGKIEIAATNLKYLAELGMTNADVKQMREFAVEVLETLERKFQWEMEWRPIETAPKDRTVIIVDGGIAYWKKEEERWYSLTAIDYPGRPIQWVVTHWMPLPKPPTRIKGE